MTRLIEELAALVRQENERSGASREDWAAAVAQAFDGEPAREAVPAGTVLHGFCNGYFGRDSYGPKTVVASGYDADGSPWVRVSERAFGQDVVHSSKPGFDDADLARWQIPEEDEY